MIFAPLIFLKEDRTAADFAGGPADEHLSMLYDDGALTRWDFQAAQKEQKLGHLLVSAADPFIIRWSADGTRMTFAGLYGVRRCKRMGYRGWRKGWRTI